MSDNEDKGHINLVGEKRSLDFKLPAWKKHKVHLNSCIDDDRNLKSINGKQFVQVLDKRSLQESVKGDIHTPLVIPLHPTTDNLQKRAEEELIRDINGIETAGSSSLIISSTSIGEASTSDDQKAPLLLANIRPEIRALRDENDRFRADLEYRAEDMNVKSNAYESVPVEQFGAALLRGMGWTDTVNNEQKTMKLDNSRVLAREHRQGLGATGQPPQLSRNRYQQKSHSQSNDWDKKLQDKLKQQSLLVGSLVWLQDRNFAGKRAVVTAIAGVPGLNKVRIAIEDANDEIIVSKETLILLTDEELGIRPFKYGIIEKNVSTSTPTYFGESNSLISVKNSTHLPTTLGIKATSQYLQANSAVKQQSSWLRTGIRVKIVSKKVIASNNRNLYLQKGSVVDVPSKNVAAVHIQIGDGYIIENVKEKYLETVLPRTGEGCLLLTGDNAGETAKLVEKRSEKGQVVIELTDSLEVIVVSMDSIAAFSES